MAYSNCWSFNSRYQVAKFQSIRPIDSPELAQEEAQPSCEATCYQVAGASKAVTRHVQRLASFRPTQQKVSNKLPSDNLHLCWSTPLSRFSPADFGSFKLHQHLRIETGQIRIETDQLLPADSFNRKFYRRAIWLKFNSIWINFWPSTFRLS